jgi:hypothetical protein
MRVNLDARLTRIEAAAPQHDIFEVHFATRSEFDDRFLAILSTRPPPARFTVAGSVASETVRVDWPGLRHDEILALLR